MNKIEINDTSHNDKMQKKDQVLVLKEMKTKSIRMSLIGCLLLFYTLYRLDYS